MFCCSELLSKYDHTLGIAAFGFMLEGEISSVIAATQFPTAPPNVTNAAASVAKQKRETTLKHIRETCLVGSGLALSAPVPKRDEGESMEAFHLRLKDWKSKHGRPAVVSKL